MLLALKPVVATSRGGGGVSPAGAKQVDVFELDPQRAQIASHAHVYATVTFLPPSMHTFTAQLEVAVDGVSASKAKNLVFEVSTACSSHVTFW